MQKIRNIILIVAALALGGCSTMANPGRDFWSYNPANYQGCTVGEYDSHSDMNPKLSARVRWWDCKDKAFVSGGVDFNGDGEIDFTYTANDVIGSRAARIRAEVEEAFAEAGVEIIPDLVAEIVDRIIKPIE